MSTPTPTPTAKDMGFMMAIFNNMRSKPDVDWNVIAEVLKLKNAATASTRFGQIKKKFSGPHDSTPPPKRRKTAGSGTKSTGGKIQKSKGGRAFKKNTAASDGPDMQAAENGQDDDNLQSSDAEVGGDAGSSDGFYDAEGNQKSKQASTGANEVEDEDVYEDDTINNGVTHSSHEYDHGIYEDEDEDDYAAATHRNGGIYEATWDEEDQDEEVDENVPRTREWIEDRAFAEELADELRTDGKMKIENSGSFTSNYHTR